MIISFSLDNTLFLYHLKVIKGKPQKKGSSLNCRAIKRGGGIKGLAIKE